MRNPHLQLILGAGVFATSLSFAAHAAPASDSAESKPLTRAVAAPTFNRDIAPIVFSHCASCHRPGQAAPFPLITYSDVKARAQVVGSVVASGLMPPWRAADGDCELKFVNRLNEAQKTTIRNWIVTGMPVGATSDLPKTPNFPEGWQLGKPDMIVKMPKAYSVPADGPDVYRTFVVPLHLTEDKWVRAIEYHPSARKEVHHTLFFYDTTGSAAEQDGEDGQPGIHGAMPRIHPKGAAPGGGGFGGRGGGLFGGHGGSGPLSGFGDEFSGGGALLSSLGGDGGSASNPGGAPFGSLGGWAVGANANFLPDGFAYHLPKGSDLLLAAHFHMSGKADTEQAEVGLYFTAKAPEKQFTSIQFPPGFGVMAGINIPAGDKDWELKDSFTLPVDVKAFGVTGHAHFIARTMALTATLPDGTVRKMLIIPNWDFAWQGQYQFKEFQTLPKGTKLDVSIHYDNSAENPSNPFSPPRKILWGTQSTAEMGSITIQVVAANEADMPALRDAYLEHVRDQFRARFMPAHLHPN